MFVAREIKQTLLHKFGKVFFDSPFNNIAIVRPILVWVPGLLNMIF